MKAIVILFTVLFFACTPKPDFKTFPKIDAHVHLETSDDSFIQLVKENNFKLLTLVTRSASQPVIREEFNYARALYGGHPEIIAFATTFTMDGFDKSGWQEKVIAWLDSSFKAGAIAVKFWKDIGMTFRDKDGRFIMIDDPRFDPIIDFIESQNKTMVNHNGEPRNCWLPVDSMTVKGDSSYFSNHPEYHMYLHPDYPSYEELLAARDRMLGKHPTLRYVACHLGSMEWNVDEQAKRLDRYPNMSLDMAARISHFKVQDREKVRDFMIKYQDRLLYGTDIGIKDCDTSASNLTKIQNIIQNDWLDDWIYFTTDKVLTQNDKVKTFQGLDLPISVLKKIYYENAMRMYPELGVKH
jgi:predicted TIM-barrel fold metal-dependent hydrolase